MELDLDYTLIRFRKIPPFGTDGVRRITSNRSELKKMTAHDFEDMLQVGGVVDRSLHD
jgi:hypothetical protein